MSSKATIYLDSSAINRLADDPAAPAIIASITRAGHEVHISCLNVLELAATTDTARRIRLLTVARRITQSFHPLELPGRVLKLSLEAHLQGRDYAVMSIDPNLGGAWAAMCRPEDIDEGIRSQAVREKEEQENWFKEQHRRFRAAMNQQELARVYKPAHFIQPAAKDVGFLNSFLAEAVRAAGGSPENETAAEIIAKVGP